MIRIKYNKEGNLLVSKIPIIVGKTSAIITINTEDLSYKINSIDNGELLAANHATTLNKVKVMAKRDMIQLGAIFSGEVRNRND